MDAQKMMQVQLLENEAEKLNQQIQVIEAQMLDLEAIKSSLEGIESSKDKSILASIGKGIFIEAELKSKNLLVNVGRETFIKKTPSQAIDIINEQSAKLTQGKKDFSARIIEIQNSIRELAEQLQKENHHCDDKECSCDDSCEGKKDKKNCKCGHEH